MSSENCISLEVKNFRVLVIGDIHFKHNFIEEGREFVNKVVEHVSENEYSLIVILGDTLDTHETVKIQPHNLAIELLDELTKHSHVALIIGNHDMANQSKFLSTDHIFTPLRNWENITIVDFPKIIKLVKGEESKMFSFAPYTPNGKFQEALDNLILTSETWEFSDCIFAHQEFQGCKMNSISSSYDIKSTKGDEWSNNYPIVISGHIHTEQIMENGVHYIGSSTQTSFGDTSAKRLWSIDWGKIEGNFSMDLVEKIDLKLRKKVTMEYSIEDVVNEKNHEKILKKLEGNVSRIKINGTSENFKAFRKSEIYKKIMMNKVKMMYNPISNNKNLSLAKGTNILNKKDLKYDYILQELIMKESKNVRKEYNIICGTLKTIEDEEDNIEIVFDSESESTSGSINQSSKNSGEEYSSESSEESEVSLEESSEENSEEESDESQENSEEDSDEVEESQEESECEEDYMEDMGYTRT